MTQFQPFNGTDVPPHFLTYILLTYSLRAQLQNRALSWVVSCWVGLWLGWVVPSWVGLSPVGLGCPASDGRARLPALRIAGGVRRAVPAPRRRLSRPRHRRPPRRHRREPSTLRRRCLWRPAPRPAIRLHRGRRRRLARGAREQLRAVDARRGLVAVGREGPRARPLLPRLRVGPLPARALARRACPAGRLLDGGSLRTRGVRSRIKISGVARGWHGGPPALSMALGGSASPGHRGTGSG